jgi:hypothetical protein
MLVEAGGSIARVFTFAHKAHLDGAPSDAAVIRASGDRML